MMKKLIFACLLITSAFLQNATLATAETSLTLYPVADNYADSKYPSKPYGQTSFLYVGNKHDVAQDIWGSERIYMRFDLTEISEGYAIVSATLRLWQYYAPSVDQTYETHRVLGKWVETAQNWDNQPESAPAATSAAVAPARTEVAVEWDITSDVKAWRDGEAPNYGTMIKVAKEQRCDECNDASSGFWSKDYPVGSHEEWRPKLIVTVKGSPARTYPVSVEVVGLPDTFATMILVDGRKYSSASVGEGERIIFDQGTTHNVTVNRIVSGSPGVRYVCDINQVQVSGPATHVFTYRIEYMVAFSTDPANLFETPPTGWYRTGETLSFKHTGPALIDIAPGTRLAFHGWSVNSRKITAESASITVNEPITVAGRYDTDYYLNLTSPIGRTEGSGWYAMDSVASFSIDRTTVPAEGLLGLLGLKRSFTRWVGSSTFLGVQTEPHGSVVMKQPTTIEAVWKDDGGSLFANTLILALLAAAIAAIAITRKRRGRRTVVRPVVAGRGERRETLLSGKSGQTNV